MPEENNDNVINPNDLKSGLIVGTTPDGSLVFSSIGQEKCSIYELLGLAETALDVLKYARDKGNTPSWKLDFTKLGLSLERLTQAIVLQQAIPQDEKI